MSANRSVSAVLVCCGLMAVSSGCRATSGAFQMDSNSRMPWFGLNLSLPKPKATRKTLETIGDARPRAPTISLADEHHPDPSAAPPRRLLPRLRGNDDAAIPAPPPSPHEQSDRPLRLEGPREEFR
jgi:hypothetical protein